MIGGKPPNLPCVARESNRSGACPKNPSTAHKRNVRVITKGEKIEENKSHSHRR